MVCDDDDILMISDDGTIIRMGAETISTFGRATQGIRLMRLTGDSKVISIARTDKEEEAEMEGELEAEAETAAEAVTETEASDEA